MERPYLFQNNPKLPGHAVPGVFIRYGSFRSSAG